MTTAYDSFEVATAVCSCPVPVVMAVGHTSDASVADECAWRSVSTPTAAGELCAQLVARADIAVADLGRDIVARSRACLERADRDLAAAESSIAAGQAQLVAAQAAHVAALSARAAAQRSSRNARIAVILAVLLAMVILLGVDKVRRCR